MRFEWSQFHDLATGVLSRSGEAGKRSAVSRAYYAAFNTARSYVSSRYPGVLSGSGKDHRAVWKKLEQGDETEAEIASMGLRLCGQRRGADYDLVWPKRGQLDLLMYKANKEAGMILASLAAIAKSDE